MRVTVRIKDEKNNLIGRFSTKTPKQIKNLFLEAFPGKLNEGWTISCRVSYGNGMENSFEAKSKKDLFKTLKTLTSIGEVEYIKNYWKE